MNFFTIQEVLSVIQSVGKLPYIECCSCAGSIELEKEGWKIDLSMKN